MSADMAAWCRYTDRKARARTACLTGIDYVDYVREPSPKLTLQLFGDLPADLSLRSFVIEGGRRIRDLVVTAYEASVDTQQIVLWLDREGDASTYRVRLISSEGQTRPRVDPRYAEQQFSFKLDCHAELDCADAPTCADADVATPAPALDYLAKDFESFRAMLLERMSLILPSWQERHLPDIGIALVELMAYVGDSLSYQQDAVATEAYLHTARLRTSVRRHARLVDYRMHEGNNARAWVVVCTEQDLSWSSEDVRFCTRIDTLPAGQITEQQLLESGAGCQVYAPISAAPRIELYAALSRIQFYTWGGEECCLPRGGTHATLLLRSDDEGSLLSVGQVLLFEEVLGADSGLPQHADPTHRHVVRLLRVTPVEDPLLAEGRGKLYEVEWGEADALPFMLVLSTLDPNRGCAPIHDVSVARGNVLLVDHGQLREEELGAVESSPLAKRCEHPLRPALGELTVRPFRPVLGTPGLTFAQPAAALLAQPAASALVSSPSQATPALTVWSEVPRDELNACTARKPPLQWTVRSDLLASSGDDPHFVVENDDDGYSRLRFGDGTHGRAPDPGSRFHVRYRVGNGTEGNVLAETIVHVVVRGDAGGARVRVRNPLPARGGTAPELVDEVRERAPYALHARRERAVIGDDYAELASREVAGVSRASAALRWTGSWYEAWVGLDPEHTSEVSPALLRNAEQTLERYRRIGHDVRVEAARYVPLELVLRICVAPHQQRAHVRDAAMRALVGKPGKRAARHARQEQAGAFFAPDQLTFGQALSLSALVHRVQQVPGVLDLQVLRFQRLFAGDQGELEAGTLELTPVEIAQLDNDPALPERGVLKLLMQGGR